MKLRTGIAALGVVFGMTAWLAAAPAVSTVVDATRTGDAEALKTLLKQGADVNAPQADGMSALHWAAERGDAGMAEMLVYAGASPSAVTRLGQYTPLHLASRTGSAAVVKTLLKAGAAIDARTNPGGATPLHLAAEAGSVEAISALIDAGADVNAKEGQWEQTPLIFAAARNRAEAVKTLVARGANPNLAAKVLDLPLYSALNQAARQLQGPQATKVLAGDYLTQQAIYKAEREIYVAGKVPEADVNEFRATFQRVGEEVNPAVLSKGGMTPLMHAVRQGYVATAAALLDAGANVNQQNEGDGTTPLLVALINGQYDAAMLLIERGADPSLAAVNKKGQGNGVFPLWAAINSKWQPTTRFPQPQEKDKQKATYLDVVQALLDKGADVNARTISHPWYLVYNQCGNNNCGLALTDGSTAFWRAAYGVDVEAMRLLHKYGADPMIPNIAPPVNVRTERPGGGTQPTPVFTGAGNQPTANPEPANAAAAAALAAGAGYGIPVGRDGKPLVSNEVEAKALPPVPYGGPGALPFHAATGLEYGEGFSGNAHRHAPDSWLAAAKYFVEELGMDVNVRDHDGYTPLHHAAARGDNEVIKYLVSKGADVTAVARSGQTTVDMANGPVQRVVPFVDTVELLMKLGAKNSNRCVSCE
jgi:ankyrin repeat protein